ncbi:MAG: extracellular solute-binding protein [Oscillospiraceae bacterium]|jgi:ABC-type glycerol-3-phosphate transport system substrate-binding protein|nr:extracellular solute-binding protein [Oscillospiraceae bacterium]
MRNKRLLASILLMCLLFSTAFIFHSTPSVSAETAQETAVSLAESSDYEAYVIKEGGIIRTPKADIIPLEGDPGFDKNANLIWHFLVPDDGWYALSFIYRSLDSGSSEHLMSLFLDGEIPFGDVRQIALPRYWLAGKITADADGNDNRTAAEADKTGHFYTLCDRQGVLTHPYELHLTAGEHTLLLKRADGEFAIEKLRLYAWEPPPSKEEYLLPHGEVYQGEALTPVEAERFVSANTISVTAVGDMSSPLTTPYDIHKLRLNTMGGSNWKYAGDRVEWAVTVPKAGLYALTFRYKQSYQQGLTSYRRLYINGAVPYTEAEAIAFPYADSWQTSEPVMVWLESGGNTLFLENTLGPAADLLAGINGTVSRLNTLYRHIVMITGTTPDIYRDYSLDIEIPGLKDELLDIALGIDEQEQELSRLVGAVGQSYILRDTSRQLKDMSDNLRTITDGGRLGRMKSNVSSMASLAMRLREQPLLLDSFTFSSPENPSQVRQADFWMMAKHRLGRFIASFFSNYSGSVPNAGQTQPLTVWISSGRDQMQILRDLINNGFVSEYGRPVNLQLVAGSVLQAILAGKGPDVALGRAETEVINFAMRDALVDLSAYPDYGKVVPRFSPQAIKPYSYGKGVYALPETQSFEMMFVRTDILNELNLEIPATWDEFTEKIFPVLQRNYLTVGVGNLNNAGALNSIFTILLTQMGGFLYTKDLLETDLTAPQALDAFDFAVSLYRDYGVPTEYDFMNRFRTGEMPIALAPYVNYNLLQAGAPEIAGLWEMTPIPGVIKADGSINNAQLMTSTAAVIFKTSNKQDAGWDFLSWWTSAVVQRNFGLQQEAVLGSSGRYATANLEAIRQLSWNTRQLDLLELQRRSSDSFVHIPGSYYTGKALNNAMVIAVTQSGAIVREELIKWDEAVDIELERKRREFGFTGSMEEANS